MEAQKFSYDNRIVKAFIWATVFWSVLGFLVGLIVAGLLFLPALPEKLGLENLVKSNGMLGYGRLRMIHTNVVIYAFVGNGFFAAAYYSMQRLLKLRSINVLSWLNFFTWQIMLLLTGVTFILGINDSKEYAEQEWSLAIVTAIAWVFFGLQMFIMIAKRRVSHLYVAIWFYIATWIGITMLWIFNNLAIPVDWDILNPKSYSIYAGVQDALVQWWFGHNAVAFFLTTPMLGVMYYFLPKVANRPVFSYKLSIIHFWSLIFVYIWAGPHHLIYTALPGWVQALGTAFSIMLIAPSWGGMLNGLLTLRGAWDKVREEPILKMFVVAVTCYGMATFEGPLLATKTLNKVGHYTDWVIAHVHVGALGWNGLLVFGILYYMVPKIYGTTLYSKKLSNIHFWLATLGIILYAVPMYIAGFTQALMWKEFKPDGTLVYTFLETVTVLKKYYILRFSGGVLYLLGALLLVINLLKTAAKGKFIANQETEAVPARKGYGRQDGETRHSWLERMPMYLSILSFVALAIGGIVEILPTIFIKDNVKTISAVKPYTPLELEGRDLYIREGCNSCHSQMIRPFRDEDTRYKGYSKAGEFVYDRPFLWGSKRTGPDLHREGIIKASPEWQFVHLYDPRQMSPGSIMPAYPWLVYNKLDVSRTKKKLETMKFLGVPYTDEEIANADKSMEKQAKAIEAKVLASYPDMKDMFDEKSEAVAMVAYLMRLGTDIQKTN